MAQLLIVSLSLILCMGALAPSLSFSNERPQIPCQQLWHSNGLSQQEVNQQLKHPADTTAYWQAHENLQRKHCLKEWTVLLYMAADNDLTPYAYWDLYEIEKRIQGEKNLGASGEIVDVVAELDTYLRTGIKRLHLFQYERPYDFNLRLPDYQKFSQADIQSPVIASSPEDGAGSIKNQKKRFQKFLSWGIKNYPAKKYMIVIWGHGEGYAGKHIEGQERREFLPTEKATSRFLTKEMVYSDILDYLRPQNYPTQRNFGGVALDHSDSSYLDIPSLHEILQRTSQKLLQGRPFDVLAFDACLMQSVEAAAELMGPVDYLAGSVQVQNYLGLPYRKIFDYLNSSPQIMPYQLAATLPKLTKQAYSQGQGVISHGYQYLVDPVAAQTFTYSALTLSEMKNFLLPSLLDFSRRMQDYLNESFIHAMELNFILQNAPSFMGETRDLGVFLGLVKKLLYQEALQNNGYGEKAQLLLDTANMALDNLNRSLLSYSYGSHYSNTDSTPEQNYLLGFFKGLSIWLPNEFANYHKRMDEMKSSVLFKQETQIQNDEIIRWSNWIDIVLNPPE